MQNRNTNRHGVPIYRDPPIEHCCWPGCRSVTNRWTELHLCDAHVRVIRDNTDDWFRNNDLDGRRLPRNWPTAYYSEPTAAPQPEKPRPKDGTIYFLRVGPHVKIGWTSDLRKRMRTYPPDSILLATRPGTRADENRLHKRFAVHRTHGREWYALVPQLLEHIRTVVQEHGQPETVEFGAKPVKVPTPHRLRQGPRPKGYMTGSGEIRT